MKENVIRINDGMKKYNKKWKNKISLKKSQ